MGGLLGPDPVVAGQGVVDQGRERVAAGDAVAAGAAHPEPQGGVGGEPDERVGEVGLGLVGRARRHDDAGLGRDLEGRPAQVEAHDGPAGGHPLQRRVSAAVVEAGVDQHVRLAEEPEALVARQAAPQRHAVGHAQGVRQRGQALALGAVAHDPELGAVERRLAAGDGAGKGLQPEVEPFPVEKPAHRHEPDRAGAGLGERA